MNYLWILFASGLFFTGLIGCMHGMFPSQPFYGNKVLEIVNGELIDTLVTSNKKKYFFYDAPQLSRRGLTYCLDLGIALKEARCRTYEQVELIHRQIYQDLFHSANSLRIIRPFLAEFPLTPNSFYLNIIFFDKDGEKLRSPNFSALTSKNKTIQFHIYDPKEKSYKKNQISELSYKIVKTIPISEATWLKEYFSSGILRSKAETPRKIPTYGSTSPSKSSNFQELFLFEKKFCDSNGLFIVFIGEAGENWSDNYAFDFVLRGERCIKLEEAQKLATRCFNGTLTFVRENQACLDYLKKRSTWTHLKDPATIPEPRHIAFRISFWDENIDRQPEPYIAEIRVLGDNCKYFTANEKQQLVLAFEETLKDPSIVSDGSKIDEAVIQPE